mmetsp:Transcript_28330/g.51213  ORF Transcript_28330/g.51213 Transcript_28330/m.51213 type:complete len:244 (-) Transcript_28330:261-992(-)
MQLLLLITTLCPAAAFMSPSPNLHSQSIHSHSQSDKSLYHAARHEMTISPSPTSITTRLHLFGFGKEAIADDQKDLQNENELARYSFEIPADTNINVKFDSLSIMIAAWAKLFTDPEQKMGLTTPVTLVELTNALDAKGNAHLSGVQFLFRKPAVSSAYKSKDDEKGSKDGQKKEEPKKEGGVEVRVEQPAGSGDLEVIASRCDIEEGTMVKEMSEQTIIDSLRKAMAAWKKEQKYGGGGEWQ